MKEDGEKDVVLVPLASRKGHQGSDGVTLSKKEKGIPEGFIKIGGLDKYKKEVVRTLLIDHILCIYRINFPFLKVPKVKGLSKRISAKKLGEKFPIKIFSDEEKYLGSEQEYIDADGDEKLIESDANRYAQAVVRALRKFPEIPLKDMFIDSYPKQDIFEIKNFDRYEEEFIEMADGLLSYVQKNDFLNEIDLVESHITQMKSKFSSYRQLSEDELCFVHGDLSWHNLTVFQAENPEQDEVCIFDLEKSCFGITWEDWARFLMYSRKHSQDVYKEAIRALSPDEIEKVKMFMLYKYLLIIKIYREQLDQAEDSEKEEKKSKIKANLKQLISLVTSENLDMMIQK